MEEERTLGFMVDLLNLLHVNVNEEGEAEDKKKCGGGPRWNLKHHLFYNGNRVVSVLFCNHSL